MKLVRVGTVGFHSMYVLYRGQNSAKTEVMEGCAVSSAREHCLNWWQACAQCLHQWDTADCH